METSWIGKRVSFLMQTIILISVEFGGIDNCLFREDREDQLLKLGILVTRRVSEEPMKILANASGYQLAESTNSLDQTNSYFLKPDCQSWVID